MIYPTHMAAAAQEGLQTSHQVHSNIRNEDHSLNIQGIKKVQAEAVVGEAGSSEQEGEEGEGPEDDNDEDEGEDNAQDNKENGPEDEEDEEDEDEDMNIQGEMEDALEGCSQFRGSFAFSKSCDAPNPGLCVADLGFIGLPLSDRDAKAIISKCEQAPFGQGERTVVDKEVRDTWQMDASQVQMLSPEWNLFMTSTVQEVCAALGIDFGVSRPRCDLHKLLLYEIGSHFLPHVDTEKVDGMFATVIIVLPSHFTGGAVHLKHDGEKKVIDVGGPASTFKTSVLAWYSDVSHEVKPVQSGYRFALSFNLIHTTNTLRPIAPTADPHSAHLQRVLRAWSRYPEDAPEKLVYLLSHKYSQANLRGNALKGSDAHIISQLVPIAEKIGFRLGLANLERHVSGSGEGDYGGGSTWGGRRSRCYYDEYDEYDDEYADEYDDEYSEVTMGEIADETTTIENLVNLDGTLIRAEVDFDEETEMIPEDWNEEVQAGNPDDEEYEGYQGNYAGTLEYFYRRTVLIIWPECNDSIITLTVEAVDKAIKQLQDTKSSEASVEEMATAERLISAARSHCITDSSAAVRALCSASCKWNNITLWLKCLHAFGADRGVKILGIECVESAVNAFGFRDIQSTIERMLGIETSIQYRLKLLTTIQPIVGAPAQDWISKQRLLVLENIKEVVEQDIVPLLELSHDFGGFAFFISSVFPKLHQSDAPDRYTINLVETLHKKMPTFCKSEKDQEELKRAITDILDRSINRADLFKAATPTNKASMPYISMYSQSVRRSPQLAVEYVKTCCQTGNADLLPSVLKRLASFTSHDTKEHGSIANEVVLPFLLELPSALRNQQPSATQLGGLPKLASLGIAAKVKDMNKAPSANEITQLIHALVLGGGSTLLKTLLLPKLKVLPWDETSWKGLVLALHTRRGQFQAGSDHSASIDDIIVNILTYIIDNTPLNFGYALYGYNYGRSSGPPASVTSVIGLLQLCQQTGYGSLYSRVLDRVVGAPVLRAQSESFITTTLASFLSSLIAFLKAENISPQIPPFSTAITIVVATYADRILGHKPPDASTHIQTFKRAGCGCQQCRQVIEYLTDSPEPSMKFDLGAERARHVQSKLVALRNPSVTCQLLQTRPRYSLEVKRTGPAFLQIQWMKHRQELVRLLQTISSSDEVLREILGMQYRDIQKLLAGQNISVGAPVSSAQRGSNVTPSANVAPLLQPPPASGSTSTGQPRTVTPKPLKRKWNNDEVIDLTTP